MVYNLFDKKSSGTGIKSNIMPNQQLAEELYKPIIKKFEKLKVYWSFKCNIWDADLINTQLIKN